MENPTDFTKLPRVLTAEEMQAVDQYTIEKLNLIGRVLMENAGRAVFAAIRERWAPLAGKRAMVLCGKGNNGGDGFVVARYLGEAGVTCEMCLIGSANELRGDAAANYAVLTRVGYTIREIQHFEELPDLRHADFIVDALLGTGVRGPLLGLMAQAVNRINESGRPVIAIDLPTGMNADTGEVAGPCVQADLTVTMGCRKQGLLFMPARKYAGEVIVADIGFPQMAFRQVAAEKSAKLATFLLTSEVLSNWVPRRPPNAFKNRVGQILVIAGSRGFGGAARLTAVSALRAGAGLVVLAAPESLLPQLEAATAEVIKLPLPEENGIISSAALESLQSRLQWADVIAIGPGLGLSEGAQRVVKHVLADFPGTLVLDADALNNLIGQQEAIRRAAGKIILTPHPGELSRLTGANKAAIAVNPVAIARQTAEELGQVLVLKGAPTVVASPTGEVFINSTGNAGMATAGSGDVLTGMIAGLAGQNLDPLRAALLGVFLHGMAGDLARDQLGEWSMLAGDIMEHLHVAIQQLARQRADLKI
ncbi:MAG: NAD(P)H-hydrate dehydratase [candidate division KSB1 bacterium]|nr:NAD(P)H-hydrate dehydratase [candidate division KSB1 bacterium]MDZ7367353.1 NAD(P)H-hydrate dehydratase [candidate division KSB1 bacterium]MDZ7405234.1 NAD(P)H-hydrate dehydratase [candidate division KSB1 bacterium]